MITYCRGQIAHRVNTRKDRVGVSVQISLKALLRNMHCQNIREYAIRKRGSLLEVKKAK